MTTAKPTKAQTEFLKRLKATGLADVHILADMATPRTINTCVANGWASVDTRVPGSPKLVITPEGEMAL